MHKHPPRKSHRGAKGKPNPPTPNVPAAPAYPAAAPLGEPKNVYAQVTADWTHVPGGGLAGVPSFGALDYYEMSLAGVCAIIVLAVFM